MVSKQTSISQLLQCGTDQLNLVTTTPRLEAEMLLQYILQVPKSYLYAHAEQILQSQQQQEFIGLLQRRLQGEPIAYILGKREFWSLELTVTPDVLIPRPDTELLIEVALNLLNPDAALNIAELGTGSGAIALALAHERPNWQLLATDTNNKALKIAQENAKKLQIKNITFKVSDWCAELADNSCDAIISNPPYIAPNDPHLAIGDLRFEPSMALVAEDNGYAALHAIIAQAPQKLKSNGWLLLEHGMGQEQKLQQYMKQNGFGNIQSFKDLAGINRMMIGKIATNDKLAPLNKMAKIKADN